MDCERVQEAILESFDTGPAGALAPAIDAHVSSCPRCRTFAARQRQLDVRLHALLVTPEMSRPSHAHLRTELRGETVRGWLDAMPDILHIASGAVATLLCAALLPFESQATVAAGTMATALTYVAFTVYRNMLAD